MMPSSGAECVAAELCGILSTPVQYRCHRLNTMINAYSPRDLQNIFPQLIDSIFNSRGGQGWGLRLITQSSNEFDLLHDFFSPLGPFLRLCYRLLDDNIKFLLPTSFLPHLLKSKLVVGHDVPNFYKDALTYDSKGSVLVLNSFDYYMFNFALHLCSEIYLNMSDDCTVYRALCCDYLQHFLRSDGDSSVLPDLAVLKDRSRGPPVSIPRTVQTPRLIKLKEMSEPSGKEFDDMCNYSQMHWRTETVLTVFTDIWLCSDVAFETKNITGFIVAENNNTVLPSNEYIRLIRILVKQFHAFSMSVRYDPNPSFVQLKLSTWKIFQDKFYLFLKQMLNRWPMDHNFILIVEMWLSFIQPWRYDRCNPTLDAKHIEINHQCRLFIADNILAYTQTFQRILERIERLDLVVCKNAVLLYRVAKVFSHSPLPDILYELELILLGPSADSPTTSSGSPKFNQNVNENIKIADAIRQKIIKLEGNDFKYKSMFQKDYLFEIMKLLKYIQECINTSRRHVRGLENTLKQRKTGVINFLKSFIDYETSDLEQSIKEGKKIPGYLEMSSLYLCEIFNINYDELKTRISDQIKSDESFSTDSSSSFGPSTSAASQSYCFLNKNHVKAFVNNLSYMGDPDLIPASSTEIKFLIDNLYILSTYINRKYEDQIKCFWYNEKFMGKVARQVLMPPMIARSYKQTKFDYSTLESTPLPPRLSLRPLASISLWIYISAVFALGSLIGYPWFLTFLFLFALFSFYILIRAVFYDTGILTDEDLAIRSELPKVKFNINPQVDEQL